MEIWKAGDEVFTLAKSLIASNPCLKDLATLDEEILIVFKEKGTKNGDHVIAGKTGKAGPLLALVGETDYKFVITLAAEEWQALSDDDREALLFHHLCACGVTENPQSGVMKCWVRIPDVSFYREEVEKYGFWRTSGVTPEPDLINDLFGDTTP